MEHGDIGHVGTEHRQGLLPVERLQHARRDQCRQQGEHLVGPHRASAGVVYDSPELWLQRPLPAHRERSLGRCLAAGRRTQVGLLPLGSTGMAHRRRGLCEEPRLAQQPEAAPRRRCDGQLGRQPIRHQGRHHQHLPALQRHGECAGLHHQRALLLGLATDDGQPRAGMGEDHTVELRPGLRIPEWPHLR